MSIGRKLAAGLIGLVALGAVAVGIYAFVEKTWSFDQDKVGAIAAGWMNVTGTWQVVEDPSAPSGHNVLAQVWM